MPESDLPQPEPPNRNNSVVEVANRYRWLVLIAMFLVFMGTGGDAIAVTGPIIPALTKAFSLSPAAAGVVLTAMFVGGTIICLPGGYLADSWGFRRTGLISIGILALGCSITYFAPSYPVVLLGRGLIGVGGGLVNIVGGALLATWFGPREMGLVMGVWAIGLPLSILWETPLAGLMIGWQGWHGAFLATTIISIGSFVMYAAIIKTGPLLHPSVPPESVSKLKPPNAFKNLELWKFGIAVLFFALANTSISAFFVTFIMTSKDITSIVEVEFYWISYGLVWNMFRPS